MPEQTEAGSCGAAATDCTLGDKGGPAGDDEEGSSDEDEGDDDEEEDGQTPLENSLTVAQCGLSSNGSSILLIIEWEEDDVSSPTSIDEEEPEPEVPELEAVLAAGYRDATASSTWSWDSSPMPLVSLLSHIDASKLSLRAEILDVDGSGGPDGGNGGALPEPAKLVLLVNNVCVSDLVRGSSYRKHAARQLEREKGRAKVAEIRRGEHKVHGLQEGKYMYLLKLPPNPSDCSFRVHEGYGDAKITAKLLL
jgi:hypothetical protein